MGGSSKPAGNTTTTVNNVPFNSGQLTDVENQAVNLAQTNPLSYYPGSTLAPQLSGPTLSGLANSANNTGQTLANQKYPYNVQKTAFDANINNQNNLWSQALPWLNALGGTGGPSGMAANAVAPSLSGLAGVASGSAPGDAAGNLGFIGSGGMVGKNPFLNSMYNSAANDLTNNFAGATAPLTDSAFERNNRFGSGGNMTGQSLNEQALGKSLANLGSSLFGNAYQSDAANMLNANNFLGGLQNTAYSNMGTIANAATANSTNALSNAATNYGNLLNADTNISNQASTLSQLPFTDLGVGANAQNQLTAQQQAQLTDAANRFYGNQYAPWATLNAESADVGGAIPGVSSSTSPYFQNPAGSAIGTGISGIGALGSLASGVGALK